MKSTQLRQAVLLVSLGTPASPDKTNVRKFLRNFLSDRRVVEAPRVVWWFVLNAIILPFRPSKIAPLYQKLWDQYADSPLRLISQRQRELLQESLDKACGVDRFVVYNCTTYMENRVDRVVEEVVRARFDRVIILPLYPQYSATTTGAVYDKVAKAMMRMRDQADLRLIKSYYHETGYRKALASSVQEFWDKHGKPDILLMSFHGIPKSCTEKGDPYFDHCSQTARNLASDLQLCGDAWQICFQSNVGRMEWLKPYTAELVAQLPARGVKMVDVVCPSFSADCIETLYEIAEENRRFFEKAGGSCLRLIPCLNEREDHIELFRQLVSS